MFFFILKNIVYVFVSISGVEQNINKFLTIARQLEACFLEKRQYFAYHKPDDSVKDVSLNEMLYPKLQLMIIKYILPTKK